MFSLHTEEIILDFTGPMSPERVAEIVAKGKAQAEEFWNRSTEESPEGILQILINGRENSDRLLRISGPFDVARVPRNAESKFEPNEALMGEDFRGVTYSVTMRSNATLAASATRKVWVDFEQLPPPPSAKTLAKALHEGFKACGIEGVQTYGRSFLGVMKHEVIAPGEAVEALAKRVKAASPQEKTKMIDRFSAAFSQTIESGMRQQWRHWSPL